MPASERSAKAWRVVSAAGMLAGLGSAWTIVAGDPVCVWFWFGGPVVVVCAIVFAAVFGRRAAWRSGLASSLLLAVSAAVVVRLGTPKYELTSVGDWLITALDDYRRDHGRYPDRLEDAGIRPAWNRFGGWEYESHDGGTRWYLSVGDLSSVNGFVYFASSERKQWSYDDG